jgi:hypothetical protein
MDERSVTRPAPIPTAAIVADEAFCARAAAVLRCCDEGPIRDAFIGGPAEEVLEMVRWALKHQDDEGFDTAGVLTGWAKKRGRGAWLGRAPEPSLTQHNLNGRLAGALIRYWSEYPHELAAVLDRVEASQNNGRS